MDNRENQKFDIKLVIVIFAILALLCYLGFYFAKLSAENEIEISDLPQSEDGASYSQLIISEVLCKNGGVYVSENGNLCDFVELYNGSSSDISLYGYGLTDSGEKTKWAFPDITIKSGEYLVVNLVGENQDGLNANFKLSDDGKETLYLIGRDGKIKDAVQTVAASKNYSMIRNGSEWLVVAYATPGYENSLDGLAEYKNSLYSSEPSALVINEFLPKNAGNFENEDGIFAGFIEIKNISNKTIKLSEYFLSDDEYCPFKYNLPEIYLPAGDIYLLYTGDNSYTKENYAGFSLNAKNGSILLSSGGKILSENTYENLANGCAYIRTDDGSYYISSNISAGFENTTDGIKSFQNKYLKVPSELIISEFMSSNSKYLAQNGYEFYDWIEFYNNSDSEINLSDYCLSTDSSSLDMYTLPYATLAPGEYYILICSGNEYLSTSEYIHAPIKIGNAESLYLSKNDRIIDFVFAYNIPINYSYSRGKIYGWFYTEEVTPKAENAQGSFAIAPSPEIELSAGIYNNVSHIDVAITGPGTIYYTTDGSEPSLYSSIYTGPISLYYTTVIKAASYIDGQLMSDSVTGSYIINDSHDLPVLSVSLNSADFNSLNTYVYDKSLEYQAYVEFFEEDGSFSLPCGIKLQGETARLFVKKNYTLKFDGEYGSTSLEYPLFDDLDCASYDSLVIRGGSNAASTMPFKDEFVSELLEDDLLVRAHKTCILYVNGQYYGIVSLREKVSSNMIADHYNVDQEKLSMIKYTANYGFSRNAWTVEYGSNTYYEEVEKWAEEHDLSVKENYDYICSKINLENFCDYWILQWFSGQVDTSNVRMFSHPDIDNGRWNYVAYDFDFCFYNRYLYRFSGNYLSYYLFNTSTWMPNLTGQAYNINLNLGLLKNEEFVNLFLTRLKYHLENDLKTERVLEIFDSYVDTYADEILRDRNKFWYDYDTYLWTIDVTREMIKARKDEMLSDVQNYFGYSDSKMQELFGELYSN